MESITMYYCDYCLDTFKLEANATKHVSRTHKGYGNWYPVQLETSVPNLYKFLDDAITTQCQCGEHIGLHIHHGNIKTNLMVWYCSGEIFDMRLY